MSISETTMLEGRLLQAEVKVQQLQKVNAQLSRIIQCSQLPQYKQLLSRLGSQQRQSSEKISHLKAKISQLEIQISFNQSRTNSLISDYQHKLQFSTNTITQLKNTVHSLLSQNAQLKKQLTQKQCMLRNQQHLIDDYKRSLQEQKQIEDEISRCEIKSLQSRMAKQLQQQIKFIKINYQEKLQKYIRKNLTQDYHKDINNLKMFLTEKKKNISSLDVQQKSQSSNSNCLRKDQNILVFDFDHNDGQNYSQTENSSLLINQMVVGNKKNQITNGNKVQKSLESTLEGSFLNNFQSKATQKSSKKQNGGTNSFNSINLSNPFNSRQPLKEVTELSSSNNKLMTVQKKVFMTGQPKTSTTKQQQQQQICQGQIEIARKSQSKFQKKQARSYITGNKQNCYITDQFRQK